MKNCYSEKYLGECADTSLYRLGELRFKVHPTSPSAILYVKPVVGKSFNMTIIDGNATFSGGAVTTTITNTTTVQVTGDCTISVDNKYNIENFLAQNGFQIEMNIEEFEYSEGLKNFENRGWGLSVNGCTSKLPNSLESLILYGSKSLEIDDLSMSDLEILSINYATSDLTMSELIRKLPSVKVFYLYGNSTSPVIKGSIEGMASLPASYYSQVTDLRFGNLYTISGNISAFANFTNLSSLHLNYCQELVGDLSSLISFQNCEIDIRNTSIYCSEDTYNTLISNGCTVLR